MGRRIKMDKANNFSNERLIYILNEMKLKYEVRESHYSRLPFEESKMVIVDSDLKKTSLIKIIENKL